MEGFRNKLDSVICGDNVQVLGTFPDACIDLVVTSPPYDNLRTYGGHSWDFQGVAAQLTRVLKQGGVIVWVVADATVNGSETGTSMRQALHFKDVCGLRLHDTMIWKRLSLPLTHNRYEQEFEFCFVLSKGRPNTFNGIQQACIHAGRQPGGGTRQGGDGIRERHTPCKVRDKRLRGNVWEIHTGFMKNTPDVVAYNHPAIFPDSLARDHILSWSNEGDIVLDPFNGSGTTTKMAREFGRRYIGIDVNEEYCAIARKRLEQQLLFGIEHEGSELALATVGT